MQSLTDLVCSSDDRRGVGLIIPESRSYFCSLEIACPNFTLSLSGETNEVMVQFELSDELSAMTSFSDSYNVPRLYSRLRSFKHDFTFSCLTVDTDVSFGKFFPQMQEPDSRLTPDKIIREGSTIYVIEFTTRHSASEEVVKRAYLEKIHKYQPILSDIETLPEGVSRIVFYVVAVGLFSTYSNLSLSTDTLQELIVRYKISCVVDEELHSAGYIRQEAETLTDEEGKLLDWFKSLAKTHVNLTNEYSYQNYLRTLQEPDGNNVFNAVERCIRSSTNEVLEHSKLRKGTNNKLESQDAWSNYQANLLESNPQGFLDHLKSISLMPWINCNIKERSTTIPDWRYMGLAVDHTSEAWVAAFERVSTMRGNGTWKDSMDYSTIEEQSFENLKKETERLVKTQKTHADTKNIVNKTNFQRVMLDLSKPTLIELAKVGVCGKKHSGEASVQQYREEKKKSFGLEVDTTDLDDFLQLNKAHMFEPSKPLGVTNQFLTTLLESADQLHGVNEFSGKFRLALKALMKSPYYQWCKIVSDIGNEVAVSMKQHCKSKEYVLKKLQDWPIYLLLKPTKSSSHCFFSIMTWNQDLIEPDLDFGHVFRRWHSNGVISWCDFISLNASKISNWVLMESRAVNLFYYWLDFYKTEPFIELHSEHISDALRREIHNMIWITTFIAIIDKAEVEEVCSLSRFIFMESFVTYPLVPRPYKMFEKFPVKIRSRFTVYLIRKLRVASFKIMQGDVKMIVEDNMEAPGETVTLTEQYVKWDGISNWITGHILENPGQMVNLMYLGYIKNKNENPESNSETKLIEKILTLEDKLTPEIQERIGVVNKEFDSGTYHEWNIDLLKWCCRKSKEHLLKKGTIRSDDDLGLQLISRLARVSVEEVLMTLKASSNFDEEWYEYKVNVVDGEQRGENSCKSRVYHRTKLIEKTMKLAVDDKTMLIDILPECLEDCVRRNHMRVCIFKKQQHGGLREIYVLNISERVVQYTVELMGRMICELFVGETMTHPESKSTLPRDHHKRVQHRFRGRGKTITTNTSADSAKWSQNQYCFKLATVLLHFYPPDLHGFILQSTQLWRTKLIKMGDSLLNLFATNNTLKLWNPLHQRMYDAYHGHLKVPWMDKGKSFVRVRSGMMQGILHYVSSAFHTVVNYGMALAAINVIQTKNPGVKIEHTNMQSSDDSGLILTINGPDTYSKNKLLALLAVCHIFKSKFSEELAIKNSIKTTFHTSRVYEFNSRFYFSSQLFEPDIKLLFASVLISQQENLLDRQDELYTLISSFVGVGGGFYLAKFAQYAQAILYYRCLGLTVCPEFGLLVSILKYVKDPSMGFFLTDHPYMCGVSGLSYNLWNCVTTSSLSGIYRSQLEKLVSKREDPTKNDILSTVSSGQLLRRIHVGWGSAQKLLAMKSRMGVPDDWQSVFNENPEALFRDAKTTVELKAKAALKLNQRGVASSLSTGIPITSIIATSVYILRDFVFSIGEGNTDVSLKESDYKGNKALKTSIFELLLKLLMERDEGLTEDQEILLFPNRNGFVELRKKLDSLRDAQAVKKTLERRRIVTKLVVYDKENTSPISTLTLLKLIWFPDLLGKPNVRFSRRLIEPLFTHLQTQVTWLSHDPKKSLLDSPFEHMHQMVNWFRSFDDKERVMCLLGAPLLSRKGRSTLMSALVNNFHSSYKLHFENDQIEVEKIGSSHIIQSMLLTTLFPYMSARKNEMITQMVKNLPSNIKFNPGYSKSRANVLVIMKEALTVPPNLPYIYDCIERNKMGYVGFWSKRQVWDTDNLSYVGDGEWTGIISGKKTRIHVSYSSISKRTILRRLEVEDLHLLERQDWAIGLREWCRESHVEESLSGLSPYRSRRFEGLFFYNGRIQTEDKGIRLEPMDLSLGFLKQMDTSSRFMLEVVDRDSGRDNGNALIRLKQEIRNSFHTILTLNFRHSDWNFSETVKITPDETYSSIYDKAWCTNSSLEPDQVHTIFKMANSKFKSLILEVTKHCLEQKGVILKHKIVQDPLIRRHLAMGSESDDLDEPILFEEGFDFAEVFDSSEDDEGEEDDVFDEDVELDAEWDQDVIMDVTEEQQESILTHVTKSHKISLEYVNDLLSTSNVTAINKVLNTGRYRSDQRDIAMVLAQIYKDRTFVEIEDYRSGMSGSLRLPTDFE